MIYAIYRGLYGHDFVRQSVESIIHHVDRIIFFLDTKAWGDATSCLYRGETIQFPKRFPLYDVVHDLAREYDQVEIIFDHQIGPWNQFTHLVNNRLLPHYPKPKVILVMEIDHIFREDQIAATLKQFRGAHDRSYQCATTRQVEVWKGFAHRVPERPNRAGAVLWNMCVRPNLPPTMAQADVPDMPRLDTVVHNFGFAVSKEVMYWKHMIALGWYQIKGTNTTGGDSEPDEDWFEDQWVNWKPGMKNLEISKKYKHHIPEVVPYPASELPEGILG